VEEKKRQNLFTPKAHFAIIKKMRSVSLCSSTLLLAAVAAVVVAQWPPAPGSGGMKCSFNAQVRRLSPSLSLSLCLYLYLSISISVPSFLSALTPHYLSFYLLLFFIIHLLSPSHPLTLYPTHPLLLALSVCRTHTPRTHSRIGLTVSDWFSRDRSPSCVDPISRFLSTF
jgi:hypothetical protein